MLKTKKLQTSFYNFFVNFHNYALFLNNFTYDNEEYICIVKNNNDAYKNITSFTIIENDDRTITHKKHINIKNPFKLLFC